MIAISADRAENVQATLDKHGLKYRLFSDASMELAQAFGLAFKVDDDLVEKYKGFGIDLVKASGHEHHILPVPAVIVIDDGGTIRFVYYNANHAVRLAPDKVIEAARDALGAASGS